MCQFGHLSVDALSSTLLSGSLFFYKFATCQCFLSVNYGICQIQNFCHLKICDKSESLMSMCNYWHLLSFRATSIIYWHRSVWNIDICQCWHLSSITDLSVLIFVSIDIFQYKNLSVLSPVSILICQYWPLSVLTHVCI